MMKFSRWAGLIVLVFALTAGGKEGSQSGKALRRAFPDAEHIDKKTVLVLSEQREKIESVTGVESADRTFSYYEARKADQDLGYAVIARGSGKSGKFKYMVVITPEGRIEKVEILEYKGTRGAGIKQEQFLAQFRGKATNDRLKLLTDIDAVTGATVSSRALTEGVREALAYLCVILDLEPIDQPDDSSKKSSNTVPAGVR